MQNLTTLVYQYFLYKKKGKVEAAQSKKDTRWAHDIGEVSGQVGL